MAIFNLEEDFNLLKVNDTCAIIDDGLDSVTDEADNVFKNGFDPDVPSTHALWHKNLLSLNSAAEPSSFSQLSGTAIEDSTILATSDPDAGFLKPSPATKSKRRRSSLYNKFFVSSGPDTIRVSLNEEDESLDDKNSIISNSPLELRNRRNSYSRGEFRTLDNFVPVRCLGQGAYGRVLLVKDNKSSKLYAMKQLKKAEILINESAVEEESPEATLVKRLERTFAERTILSQLEHPHIVKLFYSFHDNHKLYLVLQYIPGGELFYHLKENGNLEEDTVAFYAAEISCALKFLHSKGIVYRDLKPENCLLDEKGHLVLTDFGLSKKSVFENTGNETDDITQLHSIIGTPEYCAPEILAGEPYTQNCDWYSLGCLVYDMLTGKPPYTGENYKVILNKIRKDKNGAKIPFYLSDGMKDYLGALLRKDPAKRWDVDKYWFKDGEKPRKKKAGQPKTTSYTSHFIFRKIDWKLLTSGELKKLGVGPILPIITDWELAENFDSEFTEQRLDTTIYDNAIDINQHENNTATGRNVGSNDFFKGFSYVASQSYLERYF